VLSISDHAALCPSCITMISSSTVIILFYNYEIKYKRMCDGCCCCWSRVAGSVMLKQFDLHGVHSFLGPVEYSF
jgi:hypothetical protein